MKLRKLGRSDIEIAPVVLGTWALGGWLWGGTDGNQPEEAIQASLDAGINTIDTAPAYGFGLSEELVGRAIASRRDDVVVATKCGLVWDDRPGSTPFFDTTDNNGNPLSMKRCLRKESIIAECDESLTRLGVDVIDLYQCHWPDSGTPIDETMDALMTLRDVGKIREFGVSNFSVEEMTQCRKSTEIVSNQPKYSLLSREIEVDVLPYCAENNIGVLAYSPMEMGLLTGKITMDYTFTESDTRNNRPWFEPEKRRQVILALEKVRPIAEKYDATLAQVSVAWIFSQRGVTASIVGARNPDQAKSNAKAATLVLEQVDIDAIREFFASLKLDQPSDPASIKR